MSETLRPLTLEEARSWFEAAGVPITDWAKQRGFAPHLVYSLLSGRTRGCRGDAHRVAVALGIKAPPRATVLGPRDPEEKEKAAM